MASEKESRHLGMNLWKTPYVLKYKAFVLKINHNFVYGFSMKKIHREHALEQYIWDSISASF